MTTTVTTNRLAECELIIERNIQGFVEVGKALLEIKQTKLWSVHYASFDDYLRDRWEFGKRYANNLISAAKIAVEVGTIVPADVPPITIESHARELATLPTPELRAEAYIEAVKKSGGKKTTAKELKRSVTTRKSSYQIEREKYQLRKEVELQAIRTMKHTGIDREDPMDYANNPIPESLSQVFLDDNQLFGKVGDCLDRVAKLIEEIIQSTAGVHLEHDDAKSQIDHYIKMIRRLAIEDSRPFRVCLGCNNSGHACKHCFGCGWLPKPKALELAERGTA